MANSSHPATHQKSGEDLLRHSPCNAGRPTRPRACDSSPPQCRRSEANLGQKSSRQEILPKSSHRATQRPTPCAVWYPAFARPRYSVRVGHRKFSMRAAMAALIETRPREHSTHHSHIFKAECGTLIGAQHRRPITQNEASTIPDAWLEAGERWALARPRDGVSPVSGQTDGTTRAQVTSHVSYAPKRASLLALAFGLAGSYTGACRVLHGWKIDRIRLEAGLLARPGPHCGAARVKTPRTTGIQLAPLAMRPTPSQASSPVSLTKGQPT